MADMSFLPEDYLDKRAQRRANVICVVLFVVVVTGVLGAFYVGGRQQSEVKEQLDTINTRFAEAEMRLVQLDELERRKAQMMRKAKITGALLERLPRSLVLSQLINNMPPTVSLLELELETSLAKKSTAISRTSLDKAKAAAKKKAADSEPDMPEIKPTQVSVNLLGLAATDVDVAQYMTDLKNSPLFLSVNLGFSEEIKIDDVSMRKFRIETIINQDIDLRDYEPVMVKRDLKQNPMSGTVNIDENGNVVAEKPGGAGNPLIKNASDNPRKGLKE
ncbi:MAG: PilN domain-containing protein [Phycisphaeraceae bacterium]